MCGVQKDPDISYFKFPARDDLKSKWIERCNLKIKVVENSSSLYSRHFDVDYFTKPVDTSRFIKTRLKKDAKSRTFCIKTKQGYCILCGPNTRYEAADLSYHRFPSNEEKRKKWLKFCQIGDFGEIRTTNFLLCSKYFSEEDFICPSKATEDVSL